MIRMFRRRSSWSVQQMAACFGASTTRGGHQRYRTFRMLFRSRLPRNCVGGNSRGSLNRMQSNTHQSPEAYEAYLKGNYYAAKFSYEDMNRAIAQFQHAVD